MEDISKKRALTVFAIAAIGILISRLGQLPVWELTYFEEITMVVTFVTIFAVTFRLDKIFVQLVRLFKAAHEREKICHQQREISILPWWQRGLVSKKGRR